MYLPRNTISTSYIPATSELNSVQGAATITASHIDITQTLNRGRDGINGLPTTCPKHLAGFNFVRAHPISATYNHLRNVIVHDYQWGSPGSDFIAIFFPEGSASAFIQSNDERLFFMVPVDD